MKISEWYASHVSHWIGAAESAVAGTPLAALAGFVPGLLGRHLPGIIAKIGHEKDVPVGELRAVLKDPERIVEWIEEHAGPPLRDAIAAVDDAAADWERAGIQTVKGAEIWRIIWGADLPSLGGTGEKS